MSETSTTPAQLSDTVVQVAPTTQPQPRTETEPQRPERAMVIAAHPDDPEFGCGGTVARLSKEGCDVTYVLVTSGDKGSHDRTLRPEQVVATREAEQRAAAAVLGVEKVVFLRHPDGVVENSLALRRELANLIRHHEPNLVLTIDPWRRYQLHPDHRAVGWAAIDAVWSAREWNIFPEQIRPDRDPWRAREVYLFWTDEPDHWVDVGETIETRIEALRAHSSQTDGRMDRIRERIYEGCRESGARIACAYAEGFKLLRVG